MRPVIALLSGICMLIVSPDSQAWNKAGHMTSAAIAHADLEARNPVVLAKVVRLLRQHPQFEPLWALRLTQVPEEERDRYLFMLAARWPDDIRGDDDHDNPQWHFVNIPYRPGQLGMVIPQGDSILKALPRNRSIAESKAADHEDRAVALCWMFHLIGDIHQPLHTITLVTEQFPEPKGDRGGTRFSIRVRPAGSTTSLHKFWDGLVLGSERFQSVRNKATELRNRPALKRESLAAELAVGSSDDWATASYALAVEHAYRRGTLGGSSHRDSAVVLPDDYRDRAKEIAERQITLSGYRISNAMVEIFER